MGLRIRRRSREERLKKLLRRISKDLQELEDLLRGDEEIRRLWLERPEEFRIIFPRGYIRRVSEFEARFPFIKDKVLLKNIAYTFQMTEVFRWLINRFKITLSVESMIYKWGIIVTVSIIESIMFGFALWHVKDCSEGKKYSIPRKFKNLANFLKGTLKVIDEDLKDQLLEINRLRNNIHLYKPDYRELDAYNLEQYNRTIIILHRLEEVLRDYYENCTIMQEVEEYDLPF